MFLPLAFLLLAAPADQAANQPTIASMLERVGQYVRRFEEEFAIVISDEDYEQKDVVNDDRGVMRARGHRTMRSETLFAWLDEQQSWLTARSVLVVDGAPVRDSRERLDAALADDSPDARARLRRLRDEGARFNIGRIYRNFNDPTFVLLLLDPRFQPRFAFTLLGKDKTNGVDAWKIAFAERARPTVIQTPTSQLPSNGMIWVSRADGSVVRTTLALRDEASNTTAEIVVDYRVDARLGLSLPARMRETYEQSSLVNIAPSGTPKRLAPRRERIECVATYSNYRRFETSGRLVSPQ